VNCEKSKAKKREKIDKKEKRKLKKYAYKYTKH